MNDPAQDASRLSEFQKWRRDGPSAFRKAAIGLIVTALLAYASGVWEGFVAWKNYPEVMEQQRVIDRAEAQENRLADRELMVANTQAIAQNSESIRRLTLPVDIFEVSERSGPVDGYCIDGIPCDHNIRVRRNPAAIGCHLVESSGNYYYRNPRDNEVHDVNLLTGEAKNVGTSYINLPFRFTTPRNLRPGAELCVRPSYTRCPGMSEGDRPIDPDEECFEVEIKSQWDADHEN